MNYLFFAVLGLCCYLWAFSSEANRGCSLAMVHGLLIARVYQNGNRITIIQNFHYKTLHTPVFQATPVPLMLPNSTISQPVGPVDEGVRRSSL